MSGVQGGDYDAWFGTSRVWDDGVIAPDQTREKLGKLLKVLIFDM